MNTVTASEVFNNELQETGKSLMSCFSKVSSHHKPSEQLSGVLLTDCSGVQGVTSVKGFDEDDDGGGGGGLH